MPFYYDLMVPDCRSSLVLRERLVEARAWLEPDAPIGVFADGEKDVVMRVTGRGVLREWFVAPGRTIQPGEAVARMAADGEDIPYGRPYLRMEAWVRSD